MLPSMSRSWRRWCHCLRCQTLGLALVVTLATAALSHTRAWQDLELKGFDLLTAATAPGHSQLPIVLVGIDDASLAQLQQRWPWPRSLHAQLIDALSRSGAALIAFDVLFEFPSDETEDSALSLSIRNAGNVILASALVQQETSHGTAWIRKDPHHAFLSAGASTGLVNILYDRDQTLRRVPDSQDAFWRQIGKALSQRLPGLAEPGPVPGNAMIRYTGPPGTYPRISFYQALEPERYLPPGELTDTLVLIGRDTRSAADIGAAQTDTFATPFSLTGAPHMPGMEIHANLLENMMGGQPLRPVPRGLITALTCACLLLTGFFPRKFQPLQAALLAGMAGLLVCTFTWLLFKESHWWLPIGTPLSAIACMYVLQTVAAYLTEREQRRVIRTMFSRYVPAGVVNTLVDHPEKLTLGGENRELTLLFTDLAGFTSLSESLDPQRAADLLNRYFSAMNQVVFDFGGTIDKFIGDSVMAFWNAPLADPNHGLHATRAAQEMQAAMASLNANLASAGLPTLRMRIGVHTGTALVGNIGSDIGRLSYTAIGDTVNLASRLEGANKSYGTGILLSETTAQALKGRVAIRAVDRVRVKGRVHPIDVFTPCDDLALAQTSDTAIAAFRKGDWSDCEQQLALLHEHWPEDTIAHVYRERLLSVRRLPPPAPWDGSWALESK